MTLPGYNHKFGQKIMTDAEGVDIDRAFLAHYHIDAADAPSADPDGVLVVNLASKVQTIEDGITNPAVPRNLTVVGNVSGITGTVTVYGTDFAGEEIEEEFTLNGQTADEGDKAFKTITKVDLPAQVHTPAAQTETIEVESACSNTEEITVSVTAATLLGDDSGEEVTVALDSTVHTTATLVAAAVVQALNENDVISAVFTASNEAGVITLATKEPVANDSSLAIAFSVGTSGVTVGSSTDGTPGVPYDIVSIGWGDKFGLPYKLYADELVVLALVDKAKEGTPGTITPDADELAKNTFDPYTSSLGKDIDLYIIV